MATISGFVLDLGGIGSCSLFAANGLAAIGRAIVAGLAGLATVDFASWDLATGDLATTGFCFGVAVAVVDADALDSFFESFLLEAFFPRIPVGTAPLAGAAILLAGVLGPAAFTAVDFGIEVFLATCVFVPLDLSLTGFVTIGFATTFLLGAGFLFGAGLEADVVPFFAEFFAGILLTATSFDGLTPFAEDAGEVGRFPREVAPPEPDLAWDLMFDFAGFLAGGTGGSPG